MEGALTIRNSIVAFVTGDVRPDRLSLQDGHPDRLRGP